MEEMMADSLYFDMIAKILMNIVSNNFETDILSSLIANVCVHSSIDGTLLLEMLISSIGKYYYQID